MYFRAPIRLTDTEMVTSYRKPGDFDIRLRSSTIISPVNLDFTYSKIAEGAGDPVVTTVSELANITEGTKVIHITYKSCHKKPNATWFPTRCVTN